MRKNHETTDLFAVIRKSKKPMTADQIAKAAKTFRNRAAPFLKTMVSNGQILELREDEQSAPKFVINPDSAEANAPAATTPAKAPVKSTTAKAGVVKAKVAKVPKAAPAPTEAKASGQTAPTSNVHQLRPSGKQDSSAPVSTATGEEKRMEILRLLTKPMMKAEIFQIFGDVQGLLNELKAEGLVFDSYIISDYTWELTEEAYTRYPELLNPVAPVAPDAATTPLVAPADKTTEQQSLEPEAPATAPVITSQASDAQNPVTLTPKAPAVKPTETVEPATPAPAAQVPAPVAPAPAAQVPAPAEPASVVPSADEITPLTELSKTVAAVIEKMLQERLGDMAAELQAKNKKIEENQQLLTEIAAGINECTDAFQAAIGALNKFAEKISKLA